MSHADRLVEIQREQLPKLRSIYTPSSLNSRLACMVLDNYIRWFEQDPKIDDTKFYSLNGDFSDGTFIVMDDMLLYAGTMSDSYENLSRLLQLIDYTRGYKLLNVCVELEQVFKDAITKTGAKILDDQPCYLYCLSKADALKFDIRSEDVELQPLVKLQDIVNASLIWRESYGVSFEYVERIVKNNPSVGAFTKDGSLATTAVITTFGFIGSLQTDKRYRGRGYAPIVVKYLSKVVAKSGSDVYAAIDKTNIPSQTLFQKLGFKPIDEIFFITAK